MSATGTNKKASSLPEELVAAAVAVKAENAHFKRLAREFMASARPIPGERFWEIAAAYRELYVQAMRRKCDPAEQAAEELMRQAWVGSAGSRTMTFQPNSMAEAAAFVHQYGLLADNLGSAFDHSGLELDRGDDSFGDLCDALPMAGQAVCDKVMAETYKATNELYLDVIGTGGGGNKSVLSEVILEGENYFEMRLRDALMSTLKSAAQSEGAVSRKPLAAGGKDGGDGDE